MGTGYGIKCRTCNYESHVTLGVGMAYYDLDVVIDNLPQEYILGIRYIKNSHVISEEKYFHALYVCEKCNALYNKLFVKLTYDSGKVFKTKYYCEKCNHKLKRFKREEEFEQNALTLPCPQCGRKDLEINGFMLWD